MNNDKVTEFLERYGRLFAPSGSSRWLFCTGSVGLEKQIKDKYPQRKDLPSIYASEGTVAHRLGALCVTRDVSPYSYVGETLAAEDETDYTYKVDLEMAEPVNFYVEYILSHIKPEFDPIINVEKTLDLTGISPFIHSGTSDCWVYQRSHDHLHVFDYKHGKNVYVEEKNNTQMLIYALGVVHLLVRHHGIKPGQIKDLTLHIVQPRHPGGDRARSWNVSPDILGWFHEFILSQIRDAFSDSPTFAPSEHRCKWCPGREHCTARAEDAMRSAQLDFNHLIMHEYSNDGKDSMMSSPIGGIVDNVPEPVFPNIQTLTKFEIASILKWQNKIEAFLKDIGEAALKMQKEGDRLPNFKLVRGRTNRKWTSEEEAKREISKLGIDVEDMYNKPPFKSPAQIETLLRAKKISSEPLKEVITRPAGELKLAPITDKRPEVDPKSLAKHDFVEFMPKK